MADRRMISRSMMATDKIATLPAKAQLLYIYLMLYADDYGFCDQTHRAIQDAKAAKKDLEDLVKAELLIRFETGVVCVRHWWRHNSIQKSRRIETVFLREKEILIPDEEEFERILGSKKESYIYPLVDGKMTTYAVKPATSASRLLHVEENSISKDKSNRKEQEEKKNEPAPPESSDPIHVPRRFQEQDQGESWEQMKARVMASAERLGIAGGGIQA